ncbi:MAG: hypothetical protein ACJKTH_02565 [Patescibacteria group bacterium UBA2163]
MKYIKQGGLYSVGFLVVVVLGLVVLWFLTTQQQNNSPIQHVVQGVSVSGSLIELLEEGGNRHCSFVQAQSNSEIQGSVYIDNSRARANFISVEDGLTLTVHLIVRDGTLYVWSPMAPIGVQTDYNLADIQADSARYGNALQVYEYTCEPWDAVDEFFALPTEIEFTGE